MARLPSRVAVAILVFVDERLAREPFRLSKPLGGELSGLRTARNGDYRVLLDIDDQEQSVTIVRVNHRAHVYRPDST